MENRGGKRYGFLQQAFCKIAGLVFNLKFWLVNKVK